MDDLMESAFVLINLVTSLLPSRYCRDSFLVHLCSLLDSQSSAAISNNHWKSAGSLSRFFNHSQWSTSAAVRAIQEQVLRLLHPRRGHPPRLQVILDLTSLGKSGKFPAFGDWLFFYHDTYGLHIVGLYLVMAERWRVPWQLRIYRGKGKTTPIGLGIWLLRQLPEPLRLRFRIQVLADAGFCSQAFFQALRELKFDAV